MLSHALLELRAKLGDQPIELVLTETSMEIVKSKLCGLINPEDNTGLGFKFIQKGKDNV